MEIIVGIGVAISLFFLGSVTQAYNKLIKTFMKTIGNLFNFVARKKDKEKEIKTSPRFKELYGGINQVLEGRIGLKKQKVISVIGLLVLFFSLIMIIGNFEWLTKGIVIDYIVGKTNLEYSFVKTSYTAISFGLLSYGMTTTLNSLKESKDYRQQRKREKIAQKAIKSLSSKELLNCAEKKIKKETKDIKTNIIIQ